MAGVPRWARDQAPASASPQPSGRQSSRVPCALLPADLRDLLGLPWPWATTRRNHCRPHSLRQTSQSHEHQILSRLVGRSRHPSSLPNPPARDHRWSPAQKASVRKLNGEAERALQRRTLLTALAEKPTERLSLAPFFRADGCTRRTRRTANGERKGGRRLEKFAWSSTRRRVRE